MATGSKHSSLSASTATALRLLHLLRFRLGGKCDGLSPGRLARSTPSSSRCTASAAIGFCVHVLELLLCLDLVDLLQNSLKGGINPGGIEGGRLDKGKAVLASEGSAIPHKDSALVVQIHLVADEHNEAVLLGILLNLLEPHGNMIERVAVGNVVHQEGTDGPAVVRRGDGTITLLAGRVPNLRLDKLVVLNLNRLGCEFDTNGTLGIFVELILREPEHKVRLANTGIAQKDDLEDKLLVSHMSSAGDSNRYIQTQTGAEPNKRR